MPRFTGFSYKQLEALRSAFEVAADNSADPELRSEVSGFLVEIQEVIDERDLLVHARSRRSTEGQEG